MAFSQKASEQGWFYHAPAKQQAVEAVGVPPASQIPLLNDLPPAMDNVPKQLFYDTDSKYVRMAKQGGRRDLLTFKDPKPKSKEAKGYPRVDWFYLEDNAAEQAEENSSAPAKEPYQPMLPEYMVHEEYKGNCSEDDYHPKRAPYSFDQVSAFQRGGPRPTDKTVRLPEVKQMGYGVRAEKLRHKTNHYDMPPREKGHAPHGELEVDRKFRAMHEAPDSERPIMSKILSFGYANDWETSREKWFKDNKKFLQGKDAKDLSRETEYQSIIGKPESRQKPSSAQRAERLKYDPRKCRNAHWRNCDTNKLVADAKNKQKADAEKELFKMSRFKNVQAKTQSHRNGTMAVGS